MKRAICMTAILIFALLGCRERQEEQPPPPATETQRQPGENGVAPREGQPVDEGKVEEAPPPEGRAFVQFLQAAPYSDWELWPGTERLYEGTEPHGSFLTTFVNEPARQAIEEGAGQMPHGAMIVKENYTPEKQFDSVTAMYKVEGYNPEAGDWFWVKYNQQGDIEAEGRVEACINCHQQARDHDFLLTRARSQEQAPPQ